MERPSTRQESGVAIATNRNFRIRKWSAAAERAYGWSSREACGKNLDELLCTEYSGMSVEQAHAALFAGGRLNADVRHTARDGSVLAERACVNVVRDGTGSVTGAEHIFEVTSRHDEFPGLPEDFAGDVWVYDIPSGKEWHARKPSSDTASGATRGVHPDDCTEAGRVIRAAVEERKLSFGVQCRTPLEAGGYAWSQTEGRIQYDATGKPMRIAGTTIDISELKRMAEELDARAGELERRETDFAQKSRQAAGFFTDVSHDFKTPLSIMLVNLQMMEYCLSDLGGDMNKRLLKAVAMMRQNTLRLLRLSGNLLDVTRLDAGFMKARLVNADIVEIVSGLTAAVGNHAAGRGVEVSFESNASAHVMPTDTEKLERILLNLLSNAVKHTPPGGHVKVKLLDAPGSAVISVSDDGFGMSEDVREMVRERLLKDVPQLSQAGGGGMGLMLARALAELLRGRIWFESRQGQGSVFFLELPLLHADWQAPAPEADGMTRDRKVEMEFSDIECLP